jgi:hypothetical protein
MMEQNIFSSAVLQRDRRIKAFSAKEILLISLGYLNMSLYIDSRRKSDFQSNW